MSRLTLLILWILAIGAGIFYFNSKNVPDDITSATQLETGSNLIPGNAVETIDGFTLQTGEETVTLKKIEDQWVVAEKDNFPANLSTVTRAIEALRDTKVAQGVVATDEYYDRFDLDPNAEDAEEKPDTVTLTRQGEVTAKVFLGKVRQATGGGNANAGRFVRLAGDDSGVYIVQQNFGSLTGTPADWIDKTLSPLEEGTIKIEVTAPNDESFTPWTAARKTVMDDFLIEGLGEKEETKTAETGTLKTSFTRATFSELATAEDFKARADEKAARQVKAIDSAGSTYQITITPEKAVAKAPAKKDDPNAVDPPVNHFVTIEILNGPTKPAPVAEDASVQEKAVYEQRVANLADLSASVNRFRSTYEGRYFLVTQAAVGSLSKERRAFIQPKKEEKKPVSVTSKPVQVPTGPAGNQPMIQPGTPPPGIARPPQRIEAVTPPIKAPPAPKNAPVEKAKPKKKPDFNEPPLPGSKPAPEKAEKPE